MQNLENIYAIKDQMLDIQGDIIKLNSQLRELKKVVEDTILIDGSMVKEVNFDSISECTDNIVSEITEDIIPALFSEM